MDPQTAEFYRTRSAEWAASNPTGWNRRLDPFLDRLPAGARILELGCGDGRDAERMEARGFTVDASDGIAEMAAMASARLGRAVPVARFDELEAVGEYDAAWCHASLLHVPLSELSDVLALIHRALKPDGLHFANFKGGDGGARDEFGRFYNYLAVADLEAAYAQSAPWRDLRIDTAQGRSFGGAPTTWHAVTAQR